MRREHVRKAFAHPAVYLSRRYYQQWRSDAVRAFVGTRLLSRVIDYGCGDGSLSIPLLAQSRQLVLLDTSPAMLDAARAKLSDHQLDRVVLADPSTSEWRQGGTADLVLCVGVLAHVDDPFHVLRELASLVAPGGAAVLELTDVRHPIGRAQVVYSRLREWIHDGSYAWNALDAHQVLKYCAALGLELSATYRYGLPVPVSRFIPDHTVYRLGRRLFGQVGGNSRAILSCERLYYLRRP